MKFLLKLFFIIILVAALLYGISSLFGGSTLRGAFSGDEADAEKSDLGQDLLCTFERNEVLL